MMGPAFYVMAILGCGEADTACQQVGVTQAQYESADACTAATADAVGRHGDLLYPVVVAQCMPGTAKSPTRSCRARSTFRSPTATSARGPRPRRSSSPPARFCR